MIGLGILGLITHDFMPTWAGVPDWIPAQSVIACVCAAISLITGVGLLFRRTAFEASGVLLAVLAIWLLLFRVSYLFATPMDPGAWWGCGETAVMFAAAGILLVWFAGDRAASRPAFATGRRGLRIARMFFGFGLIQFGIGHFTFFRRTIDMVPAWMPWHVAWASFTGCAFIVAGIAVLIGVAARLAAALSALELGLLTLLVWLPIVATMHPDRSQWTEFVSSVTLTAAAWVVADSYRRRLEGS
jgi:uncharacterized membrane protein